MVSLGKRLQAATGILVAIGVTQLVLAAKADGPVARGRQAMRPGLGNAAASVSGVAPTPATANSFGGGIHLSASVSSSNALVWVRADVTYPDGRVDTVPLSRTAGTDASGTWNGRVDVPANHGTTAATYQVVIGARDVNAGLATSSTSTFSVRPAAANDPAILIKSAPGFGSFGSLEGVAQNAPAGAKVAAFIYVENVGYFTKPLFAQRTVLVAADGSWSASVTTGGVLDTFATELVAYLLPASYDPPSVSGAGILPLELDANALARATVRRKNPNMRIVRMANRDWFVKTAPAPVFPGPIRFSDAPESVYVDATGKMHLLLANRNGVWMGSEIEGVRPLGYGTYRIRVHTNLTTLDANTVFGGLFLFSKDPSWAHREIDAGETSGWGQLPVRIQQVVQPFDLPGRLHRVDLPASPTYLIEFRWTPDQISFRTLKGTDPNTTDPSKIIDSWTFNGDVPLTKEERAHLNVWYTGGPPISGQTQEIVISDFEFIPESTDSAAPFVGIATASPQLLPATGGTTTFAVTCTDNVGMSRVEAEVLRPDGAIEVVDLQLKSGNLRNGEWTGKLRTPPNAGTAGQAYQVTLFATDSSYNRTAGIPLTVGVNAADGADIYEPDDAPQNAKSIAPNESQARTMHLVGTADWAKFRLNAPASVDIFTTNPSGFYTELFLYGPDRSDVEIARDAFSSAQGSRIRRPYLAAGEYFIKAQEYGNDGTIGSYTLSLTTGTAVSVSLLSPNGAESWNIGTTQRLQWSSTGNPGTVKVELSRDGGSTWETLFASLVNDGEENWVVSGPSTGDALVRVTSTADSLVRDQSEGVFRIVNPNLNAALSLQAGVRIATGGVADVGVDFNPIAGQITGLEFVLLYDSAKVALDAVNISASVPTGYQASTSFASGGRRVLIYSLTGAAPLPSGRIASLKIRATNSFANGATTPLLIALPTSSNPGVRITNAQGISADGTASGTTVTGGLRGDLDGDLLVSVTDLQKLINVLLRNSTIDLNRGDLNNDNRVDVGDLQVLINMILGIASASERPLAPTAVQRSEFQITDGTIDASGQAVLKVRYAANGSEVTIGVFDLEYDAGVLELLGIDRAQGLPSGVDVLTNTLAPGRVRVLVVGVSQAVPWNSGEILHLRFRASGSFPAGQVSHVTMLLPDSSAAGCRVTDGKGKGFDAVATGGRVLRTGGTLAGLSLRPASVVRGGSVNGTVTLTKVAAVDTVVTLSTSNSSAVSLPETVTVLQGAKTARFTVKAAKVGRRTVVKVQATSGSRTKSAKLTIR